MVYLSAEKYLQSQGWGTRKECRKIITQGQFTWNGQRIENPEEKLPLPEGEEALSTYRVGEEGAQFRRRVVVALFKPRGYECSASPQHHQSVLDLLNDKLRRRGVQPVGRLDQDTTGLLILTDDGDLSHRLASPKHHVSKTYLVLGEEDFSDRQIQDLLSGVLLNGEAVPDRALSVRRPRPEETPWKQAPESRLLEISIDQGKYHQVRRMVAAAGNRCRELHRQKFGDVDLKDLALEPGGWVYLEEQDVIGLLG